MEFGNSHIVMMHSTEKNKITAEEFFNKLIDSIDDPEVNKDDVRMILKNQFKFIKENKKK